MTQAFRECGDTGRGKTDLKEHCDLWVPCTDEDTEPREQKFLAKLRVEKGTQALRLPAPPMRLSQAEPVRPR